ncbi:PP2C family protein-serine/threonine phosphatase [Streptomyces pactum]|uniref:PP2C family protein-serine/threonine phosphatase n=1 Tax=Streptomyces pactum TaxID=68249 RepID=UPI0036FD67DB
MGEATPGPAGTPRAGGQVPGRGAAELADVLAPHLIEAVQRSGGYGGGVYLRSPDRRSLVLAAVTGVPRSVVRLWWRIPVSGALPAPEAYRTGRPVHLADEGETMRRYPQMLVGTPYQFASHYEPVRVAGEVVGVVLVLWSTSVEAASGDGGRVLEGTVAALGAALSQPALGGPVEYDGEPRGIRLPGEASGVRVGVIDWDLDTGRFVGDEGACEVLGIPTEHCGGTMADLEDRIFPEDLHELRAARRDAERNGWIQGRVFRIRDDPPQEDGGGKRTAPPDDVAGAGTEVARAGGTGPAGGGVPHAPGPGAGGPGTAGAGAAEAAEAGGPEAADGGPPGVPGTPGGPGRGAAETGGTSRAGAGGPGSGHRAAVGWGVGGPEDDEVRYRPVELWGRFVLPEGEPAATAGVHRRVAGVVVDAVSGPTAAEAAERLPDGVFALDPDGRLTYANRSCEQLLRCAREELLGRRPWHVLPWLSDPAYEDRYRAAMLSQQSTSFLARHPVGQWLGFVLHPDAYGLTGRVVPSHPPPEQQAAPAAAPVTEPGPEIAAPVAITRPGALYHVVHLASVLTEAVSVREVCQAVADRLLPMFGGHELALYLVRDRRMYLAWESGYPEGFLDSFEGVGLDARLPGVETLTSGVPIFFESPEDLAGAYPGIAMDRMRSWAFLPLIASGHPVGSCILGYDATHPFTADERAALTALGGLVAQALERARLYDAEFALARGLQDALLPHRLPPVRGLDTAARYLPGTQGMEIGGDWYDVIETPGGVALVIGDVEGHSVAAAAVMGQLRSAVNALATSEAGPAEVVGRTNSLLADLDAGLFATCCYLEVDPRTGRGLAVRAGHTAPVLRHPDGRTELLAVEGGLMLGVDARERYPVTPVELPRGSVLSLYTDGLVEQRGQDIEDGVRALCDCLARTPAEPLEEMADSVVQAARRTAQRPDDVALLLASRRGD